MTIKQRNEDIRREQHAEALALGGCECDSTHQNVDTVCRWCWAHGRRHWNDPDVTVAQIVEAKLRAELVDTPEAEKWLDDHIEIIGIDD